MYSTKQNSNYQTLPYMELFANSEFVGATLRPYYGF